MKASSPRTSLTLSIHLLRLEKEFASTHEKCTRDVEDNDGRTGILDVGGDKGMKALLASSIPKLHPKTLNVHGDCLRYEVDSNGWLPR